MTANDNDAPQIGENVFTLVPAPADLIAYFEHEIIAAQEMIDDWADLHVAETLAATKGDYTMARAIMFRSLEMLDVSELRDRAARLLGPSQSPSSPPEAA